MSRAAPLQSTTGEGHSMAQMHQSTTCADQSMMSNHVIGGGDAHLAAEPYSR